MPFDSSGNYYSSHDDLLTDTPWCFTVEAQRSASDSVTGPQGNLILEDYCVIEEIGVGGTSSVVQVVHKIEGKVFAIKRIPLVEDRESNVPQILNKINILETVHHASIVKFEGFYSNYYSTGLVFEFAPRGDLHDLIFCDHPLSHTRITIYINQLAEVLNYLHGNNIIHRDVKSSNVLVFENDKIKLADFGLATFLPTCGNVTGVCGTPLIQAPEIVLQRPYSKPVDWWALGILMYQLVTRSLPFEKRIDIITPTFDIQFPKFVKLQFREIISLLLVRDPHERLTSLSALQGTLIFSGEGEL